MQTIKLFDYLLNIPNNQVVAIDSNQAIQYKDIKSYLLDKYREALKNKAKSYFLHAGDGVELLVSFLALLLARKNIIFPQHNGSSYIEHLNKLQAEPSDFFDTRIKAQLPNGGVSLEELRDIESVGNNITFYTSGSSGQPKKVVKSLDNLLNEIVVLDSLWGKDVSFFYSTVSHQHLYGLIFNILWPFFTGKVFAKNILTSPEMIAKVSQADVAIITSPTMLSCLDSKLQYPSFRYVFSSGGALSNSAAAVSFNLLGLYPIEVYGSTETGGIGYRQMHDKGDNWKPLPQVRLYPEGDDVSVSSPFFIGEKVTLDDHITLNANGTFLLSGRKDKVVKIGERRISLCEVELYLAKHNYIESSVCLNLDCFKRGLSAMVVLNDGGFKHLNEKGKKNLVKLFQNYLKDKVHTAAIPRRWRFVVSIPRNSMSKIDKTQIKELFCG